MREFTREECCLGWAAVVYFQQPNLGEKKQKNKIVFTSSHPALRYLLIFFFFISRFSLFSDISPLCIYKVYFCFYTTPTILCIIQSSRPYSCRYFCQANFSGCCCRYVKLFQKNLIKKRQLYSLNKQ